MDFITDWVYCATLYPSATFLRACLALQSFDNLRLTCKLEFPLDVGTNEATACQITVVTNLGSCYFTSPHQVPVQYGELELIQNLIGRSSLDCFLVNV